MKQFLINGMKINWKDLRKQKQSLMIAIDYYDEYSKEDSQNLFSILHLIDNVQDNAVESGIWTEEEIFGNSKE